MAKRPEQSLDVLGQSLLSQQAATRAKEDKKRRKDRNRMLALGTLVAGQSLVNNALKKRTKEIADLGEMSKYKSKVQADNLQLYSPLFQSTQEHDTYEDWEKYMQNNPSEYRKLQGHLEPIIKNQAKYFLTEDELEPEFFRRVYGGLKNHLTDSLAESTYKTATNSEKSFRELFNLGASEFAAMSGVDPSNKEALYNFLSTTDQNSLDAYKAKRLNEIRSSLDSSIINKGTARSLGNAITFGLIKDAKGQSNPFKKVDSSTQLLPTSITKVFDQFNIRKIIKDELSSDYAILRNEEEAFKNNPTANESMQGVFDNIVERINAGTWRDVSFLPFTEPEGGHRTSAYKEDEIDNVYRWVKERPSVEQNLITYSGTLANLIGSPERPKDKYIILDKWLELPDVKKLGIKKGDPEYQQMLGKLESLKGRQEFAIDLTIALSIKDTGNILYDDYDVNWDDIRSITGQKFISDEKNKKWKTTELYDKLSPIDKEESYKTMIRAILINQPRSNLTSTELVELAKEFMKQVPPPSGDAPQIILDNILSSFEIDSFIPFADTSSVPWEQNN
tara:strand:+ start:1686 stop:3371 length:1686 start_codon:yes stop_codon:yes gene_type:complete